MQSACAQASSTFNPSTHRVIELFAGVGGFHYGLEQVNQQRQAAGLPRAFDVVWASQWEPDCKRQHAARVYEQRWGLKPVNRDIAEVLTDAKELAAIAALAPTMLVGGFPCQDYSVAKPASKSEGLQGKKGVLWWSIHRLLEIRIEAGQPIEVLMLENVDRLINSPSACRGRDFAIILASLQGLGYAVAWQIVNSADYGFPQRRKRIFITAVHQTSGQYQSWLHAAGSPATWLASESPLAVGLPINLTGSVTEYEVGCDTYGIQANYQPLAKGRSRFGNCGVCINGKAWSAPSKAASITDFTPFTGQAAGLTLGDVVARTVDVPKSFYLAEDSLPRWHYLKGAKSITRTDASGTKRPFNEGAVSFPDSLDKPARTVITSEGGPAPSRTKHVIKDISGQLRRLTPDELDELNGVPRGFTVAEGVTDIKRAFLMGNALVTGVVKRIGAAMTSA